MLVRTVKRAADHYQFIWVVWMHMHIERMASVHFFWVLVVWTV